jgi:transposase InsO family protein
MMCALYGVTRGGFYAWQAREPSARSLGDAQLIEHVARVHRDSRGFYGSPRVTRKLCLQGVVIGRRRVSRLMRLARLQGRSARLYRRSRVGQHAFFASIANRQRAATLQAPDQIWVADVTYLRVAGRWRYLAAVMDKHSRRIVGWSMSDRRDVALTVRALRHAVRHRQPTPGCIFHTDRGIEYAAFDMRDELKRHGLVQSMNRPGRMNDNAHMESFFHSMKTEALYGLSFDTDNALRRELRSYIQFYNQQRLHSALDYLPPVAFERREAQQACVN